MSYQTPRPVMPGPLPDRQLSANSQPMSDEILDLVKEYSTNADRLNRMMEFSLRKGTDEELDKLKAHIDNQVKVVKQSYAMLHHELNKRLKEVEQSMRPRLR